jgi:hypothetical protein
MERRQLILSARIAYLTKWDLPMSAIQAMRKISRKGCHKLKAATNDTNCHGCNEKTLSQSTPMTCDFASSPWAALLSFRVIRAIRGKVFPHFLNRRIRSGLL